MAKVKIDCPQRVRVKVGDEHVWVAAGESVVDDAVAKVVTDSGFGKRKAGRPVEDDADAAAKAKADAAAKAKADAAAGGK